MAVGTECGGVGREVEQSGSVPPRPTRNQGAGVFSEPFSFCAPGPAGCVPGWGESVTRSMEQRTSHPRRRRGHCGALGTFPKMAAGAWGRGGRRRRAGAGQGGAPRAGLQLWWPRPRRAGGGAESSPWPPCRSPTSPRSGR
nr:uncharacterized protein LOC100395188 isoform X2 [Callithrix jacchus]